MCPHTAIYVSSYCYICVLILYIYVSSYCYVSVSTAASLVVNEFGSKATKYVSSYCCTCVLILLYMCLHTAIHVSSYCYICVSSYCYVSVSTAASLVVNEFGSKATKYVSSYCYTRVLILLYMCPHTTMYPCQLTKKQK